MVTIRRGHAQVMTTVGEVARVTQGLGTGGRAVGSRTGPWVLAVVDSADISADRMEAAWERLRKVSLPESSWTEKRLLRPNDILVTGRSETIKVALVPTSVSRAVAAATLLVVRADDPGSGLAHFLWYFLTSRQGRTALSARITRGMTVPTLSVSALSGLALPVPDRAQVAKIARLVEESELTYAASIEATRLRRETVRDAVFDTIARGS